jgi:hypothetical protein
MKPTKKPVKKANDKHYRFYYRGLRIDPYRIMRIYRNIRDPEHQHAVKKLLRAGESDAKGLEQDIDEVIMSLNCWKKNLAEDAKDAARAARLAKPKTQAAA